MSTPPYLSARAWTYLEATAARIAGCAPWEVAQRVEALVARQDLWRAGCLNLNPAESLMSPGARRLLASDMATRLSEGFPGDKVYPHGAQNDAIDEIEATAVALARAQFGARHVDWRPVSTSMANAVVFAALLTPGDVILAQSEEGGGNFSYHAAGPAGLFGATIHSISPSGDCFEIDPEAVRRAVRRLRPRLIVIGGSNVLFPYPVRAIREVADEVGALVLYDAAHLGLLVSHGEFQRPLAEGAHLMTVSTHKVMGGPVGGLVLTDDDGLAAKVLGLTFPGFLQTRDQNKYAALAYALAENQAAGDALAAAMVESAKALGAALADQGFEVLGAKRGFTDCAQLFLRLGAPAAQTFEAACLAGDILLADCALTGDIAKGQRTGVRLATHELTRQGILAEAMPQLARLLAAAARGASPARLAAGAQDLLATARPGGFGYAREAAGG